MCMYIWTEGRGGGLFAKQFLILTCMRGQARLRITFILSSLCLLLFVVFLLLRIRPIGGVLCVSFFCIA